MKKFYVLIAVLLSCFSASSAYAIEYNMSWTGNGGYSMEGLFSFDETTAPAVISEFGSGATSDIISISATFFDPTSTPITSVTPVIARVSNYSYLEFNFDTVAESILLNFDVGIDNFNPGDIYLISDSFGTDLNQNDSAGIGVIIDTGGTISVSRASVPEPATLALFGIGLAGLGFARKKMKSA